MHTHTKNVIYQQFNIEKKRNEYPLCRTMKIIWHR